MIKAVICIGIFALAVPGFAQTPPGCIPAQILGVTERTVHNPPWGPSHYVDIAHNGVLWMKLTYKGSESLFSVTTNPVSRQIDKNCMTEAETLLIEAWKSCSEPTSSSASISAPGPQLSLDAVKGPPGVDPSAVRVTWKALNAWPPRLRGVVFPGNRVVRDSTGWDGTKAEGSTYVPAPGDAEGILVITLSACGQSQQATIDLTQNDCEKKCDKNECDVMPKCVGAPVSTVNGNMQYEEVDPVPSNAFLPFRRTYLSRSLASGFFGIRWFSIFDAALSTFDDVDGTRYVSVMTESREVVLFSNRGGGGFSQIGPESDPRAKLLQAPDGSWIQTSAGGRLQRIFNAQGLPISFRDVPTGREVLLSWTNGLPVRVEDSWGNWALNVTVNATTRRVTSMTLDGQPTRIWTYVYSNYLTRVDSPAGTWRTYEYNQPGETSKRLTAIRDGNGNLIESHGYYGYNTGRALTSYGPGGEIDSVTVREAGRNNTEFRSSVRYKNGRTERYYHRSVAGAWRTVEVDGGCATCGKPFAIAVYDTHGNVIRGQASDGSITDTTYDPQGVNSIATKSALRPLNCDPATAVDRCRLTPDALALVDVIETDATVDTTFRYDDPYWPQVVTTTETVSVMDPTKVRREILTLDMATGDVLQRTVQGWTGSPPQQESRIVTTMLYDGWEGAAFDPGGEFDTAWLTLPQPRLRKSIDGARTDVVDVDTYVYFPVDANVPATSRGRIAAMRNAAGHIVRFSNYDEFGNARRVVDANGVIQERTCDAIGRCTVTTVKGVPGCDTLADPLCALDLVRTRVHTGAGALASEQSPSGGMTVYQYDSRGRISTVSRGPSATDLRERVESQYDALTGNKNLERKLAFSGGSWVEKTRESYSYDAASRLERVTHADGSFVIYAYDAAGRIVSVRDENHASPNTLYAYDPAGRLVTVTQSLATSPSGTILTGYAYDAHGNLTSVTDPNGNVTTYVFDDFGQMLSQNSPVTGTTVYSYDDGGQLIATVDANGAQTTRTYDVLGRILTSNAERLGVVQANGFTYDAGILGVGRMTSMADATGSSQYLYERRGLLLREEKTINGWPYITAFAYDRDGNRSRIGYPSGRIVDTTHDYAGRPTSLTSDGQPVISSASYLPFGPATQIAFGNGTTRTRTFDNRYRLSTNTLTGPLGLLASYQYGYDAAGNVTQIDDLLDPAYARTFGYDDLNRLTVANTGAGLWGTGTFGYDAMGNLLSSTIGTNTRGFTYAGSTPLLATVTENGVVRAVTYDPAGNEQTVGSESYNYTPANQLAATTSSAFANDARGIRTITNSIPPTSTETHSLYLPELHLLAEASVQNGVSSIAHEYLWFGSEPAAQFDGPSTIHYAFTDALGTPILTTDPTATIDWRVELEPYGSIFTLRTGAARHQPLAFPGQERGDGELSYNIFRWYRAGWGRYTQGDPLEELRASEPNLYRYARANPVSWTDPHGLFAIDKSCDCTPGGYPFGGRKGVQDGIDGMCNKFLKKPKCAQFVENLQFGTAKDTNKSEPLGPCLRRQCKGDTVIRCAQNTDEGRYRHACAKNSPFDGSITLLRGAYTGGGPDGGTCYYDMGHGWSHTILHEAVHTCGLDDETWADPPDMYTKLFQKIMFTCGGVVY